MEAHIEMGFSSSEEQESQISQQDKNLSSQGKKYSEVEFQDIVHNSMVKARQNQYAWETDVMDYLDTLPDSELLTARISKPQSQDLKFLSNSLVHFAVLQNSLKLLKYLHFQRQDSLDLESKNKAQLTAPMLACLLNRLELL